jgi:ABC-type branched-subunit amino acid transport system ATPase component
MGVEAGRQLQAGDCFGLLGPKRAGKTTTIETCEGSAERASMQTGLRDDFFQPRSEPSLIHTQHFQACSQERPFSNPLSLDELRARSLDDLALIYLCDFLIHEPTQDCLADLKRSACKCNRLLGENGTTSAGVPGIRARARVLISALASKRVRSAAGA